MWVKVLNRSICQDSLAEFWFNARLVASNPSPLLRRLGEDHSSREIRGRKINSVLRKRSTVLHRTHSLLSALVKLTSRFMIAPVLFLASLAAVHHLFTCSAPLKKRDRSFNDVATFAGTCFEQNRFRRLIIISPVPHT